MREDYRCTDPQPASRCGCAKDHRFTGFGDFTQQPVCPLMQRPSFIGQSQGLRPALDKPHAKALFEFAHPSGQSGFGAARNAGSTAKPAMSRDEVEVGQGLNVHAWCSEFETLISILASPKRK